MSKGRVSLPRGPCKHLGAHPFDLFGYLHICLVLAISQCQARHEHPNSYLLAHRKKRVRERELISSEPLPDTELQNRI